MTSKVFIIAEAGVNHNGILKNALKLIDVAKEAGADCVKFQNFIADEVVLKSAKKCDYQIKNTGNNDSQYKLLKELELDERNTKAIFAHGKKVGIEVLSTAFDLKSLSLLKTQNMKRIKIPSGEIHNFPLLIEAAKTKLPIILSTGMATIGDVEKSLEVLAYAYIKNTYPKNFREIRSIYLTTQAQKILREKVTILHCTTNYPALAEQLNLNVIDTMKSVFGLNIGYSDHSLGILASCIAVSKGATVIEKHFTLDKNAKGPDHKASLDPQELKELVSSIRLSEKMLGSFQKIPAAIEYETSLLVRKSIVAGKTIKKGEKLSLENLKIKRPGDGLDPSFLWSLIGTTAKKNFQLDESIDF